jgi:hypothetical protein
MCACATGASRTPTARTSTPPWTVAARAGVCGGTGTGAVAGRHGESRGARPDRGPRRALRHGAGQPTAALDRAYARAMREVRERFPGRQRCPHAARRSRDEPASVGLLERDGSRAPARPKSSRISSESSPPSPDHPGACHYYIHAVEACVAAAGGGVRGAPRLTHARGRSPRAHARAHLHPRGTLGRCHPANEHAVHSDETYIADQGPTACIRSRTIRTTTTSCRSPPPWRGARHGDPRGAGCRGATCPWTWRAPFRRWSRSSAYVHLVLVTFGRWDDVLSEPEPPADLMFATAIDAVRRGVAHAARNEGGAARDALDAVQLHTRRADRGSR